MSLSTLSRGSLVAVTLTAVALATTACGRSGSAPARSARQATSQLRWQVLPPAPIRVDAHLTAVWTGKELVVSGVCCTAGDGSLLAAKNVAAAYDPRAHAWRRLPRPLADAGDPVARTAVWTGKEALVWGAFEASAFDPATNRWHVLPRAPTGHGVAVWTGREMIGWGGGCCGDAWSSGSAYDPATHTWRTLAASPLAPSQRPLAAWTGRRLLVVVAGIDPGGEPYPARFARAAAYDPRSDSWTRLAAPPAAAGDAAVWDGHELLVAGFGRAALAYDPAGNRWRRLAPAPAELQAASAVWTGGRLVLFGGAQGSGSKPARGLAYDPKADRWSTLPALPFAQHLDPTAIWTGSRLLVWTGAGTPAAL